MKQNQTWPQETPHLFSTPSLMSSTSVEELLNHWAWKFHTYFFAALYIVFAVNCLIAFVRQSSRSVNKSVYQRFTTTQLFVAAVVKAALSSSVVPLLRKRNFQGALCYRTSVVQLFKGLQSIGLQHTSPGFTRINKGFNRVAAPSKYLGVTRFHSYLHGNPCYVQFAGTVRRQGALALYLRSGPLYMGRTNLL